MRIGYPGLPINISLTQQEFVPDTGFLLGRLNLTRYLFPWDKKETDTDSKKTEHTCQRFNT